MEYSDYVETRPHAATLDGTEKVAMSQGGEAVEATTQEIADLGGGGGAVASVNGQTGVVVLDATDVGADPAGSASTVAGNLSAHIADATDAHAGTAITNTPAGNIAATTVQAAINELDVEKMPLTSRVQSVVSSATVTPNADTDDLVIVTAQAAGITLANPTGTPTQGQGLVIRLKDNGTSRSITYGSEYRALGVTLPTVTVISKTIYLAMVRNTTDTKWDVIGVKIEA